MRQHQRIQHDRVMLPSPTDDSVPTPLRQNERPAPDIRVHRVKLGHRRPHDKLAGIAGGIRNDINNDGL